MFKEAPTQKPTSTPANTIVQNVEVIELSLPDDLAPELPSSKNPDAHLINVDKDCFMYYSVCTLIEEGTYESIDGDCYVVHWP